MSKSRAELGIQRSADSANRRHKGWTGLAIEMIRKHARPSHTRPFTIEEIRKLISPQIPQPKDQRAWGFVTQLALKHGYLVRVDGKFKAASSSNGGMKQLYVAGPNV